TKQNLAPELDHRTASRCVSGRGLGRGAGADLAVLTLPTAERFSPTTWASAASHRGRRRAQPGAGPVARRLQARVGRLSSVRSSMSALSIAFSLRSMPPRSGPGAIQAAAIEFVLTAGGAQRSTRVPAARSWTVHGRRAGATAAAAPRVVLEPRRSPD